MRADTTPIGRLLYVANHSRSYIQYNITPSSVIMLHYSPFVEATSPGIVVRKQCTQRTKV